jgi:hypothetical protein
MHILLLLAVGLGIAVVLWRTAARGAGSAVSLEEELVVLCLGSKEQAEALIRHELQRAPGANRRTAVERAVRSIKRDRR